MKQKTALVTGASGFIGQHLVQRLLEQNIRTGFIPRALLSSPNELKEFLISINPNYIFHLAAYGNHSNQYDFNDIVASNVIKTALLLDCSKSINYEAFINFGSSSEYGKKDLPMSEDDRLEPNTFYGATKAASTLLSRAFAEQYAKPIVTVRPFSVYGEGEAEFRFIPTMIKGLLNMEHLPVVFEPKHDWIYVQDFIDGILRVTKNADRLKGKAINIGTGVQYSNLEVVNILEKITGKTIEFDPFNNPRNYDNDNWVADNRRLRLLGWTAKHTLTQGLTKTYEYYKNKYAEQRSKKKNN